MSDAPNTDELLRAILARLDAIEAAIGTRAPRPTRLAVDDERALGAHLPAIAGAIGPALFNIRELFAHAERHDVPGSLALRFALGPYSKQAAELLGRRLAKAAKRRAPIAGFIVQRVGKDAAGVLWRVDACASPSSCTTPDRIGVELMDRA